MTAPSRDVSFLGKHSSVFMELPPKTSNTLGNQEAIYAVKLTEYNKLITRGNTRINLISVFASAAEEFNNAVSF